MDFGFRPDIDAARRLVHDEDRGLGGKPFGENDLLLIAARQLARRLPGPACPDPQALDEIPRQTIFLAAIHDERTGEFSQHGERDILGNGLRPHQALKTTVFRHIGDPEIARLLRRFYRDGLALDQDLARGRGRDAENGECRLGAPRADEPGKPYDFA